MDIIGIDMIKKISEEVISLLDIKTYLNLRITSKTFHKLLSEPNLIKIFLLDIKKLSLKSNKIMLENLDLLNLKVIYINSNLTLQSNNKTLFTVLEIINGRPKHCYYPIESVLGGIPWYTNSFYLIKISKIEIPEWFRKKYHLYINLFGEKRRSLLKFIVS